MPNPFRRHQQHVRGLMSGAAVRAASLSAPAPDTAEGQEYAALLVALHDNLRTLSDIKSVEARAPYKAEMAKTFAPWIEGVLAAGEAQGTAAEDEILIWNMVWAFDYRDIDYALRLAAHGLRFGLSAPERFNSTLPCVVAETAAKIALDNPAAITLQQLLRVVEIVGDADMFDQAKAKLAKAVGRAFAAEAEAFDPMAENAAAGGKAAYLAGALEWLTRARDLGGKNIGVVKDIEAINRAMRALSDTSPPPG
ncbi:terminase [Novosphingobium umbonatum]|uniref:Terminase n=1 Tax=Novosphingobium umbonatum TaxID=1908524 RepID=A0A3S2UST9_9SPHN|nr:phage terminase small subunit [Novosphingobium umbonatum]RVU03937.1 terminase [Novosphingobium umbonatum]